MKIDIKSIIKNFWLYKYYRNYKIQKIAISDGRLINRHEVKKALKRLNKNGLNQTSRSPALIVSLTSFPERIHEVPFTIYSLLTQTCKPDLLILWLSYEEFPNKENSLPEDLLRLTNYGLTIKWIHNIYSYKKIIPTLKEYPNDIIVTADDDIYYPNDWLENLYESYYNSCLDNVVYCHRMHKITLQNGFPAPYEKWIHTIHNGKPSYLNFATSGGGVLYPPHCFHHDVSNEKIFTQIAPKADDIWLWAMIILNGYKYVTVQNNIRHLKYINILRELRITDEKTLSKDNCLNCFNDIQINNIINKYQKILDILNQTNCYHVTHNIKESI